MTTHSRRLEPVRRESSRTFRYAFAAIAAASIWAGPCLGKTPLPAEVTDGMYVTLGEVRANSERTFDALAGAEGAPIAKDRFVSNQLPAGLMPNGSPRELLAKLFEQLDADGDDRLTRAEWRARIDRDLEFADADNDGKITLRELAQARENMSVGDALGLVF